MRGRPVGAMVGGLLPVVGFVGAAMCDEHWGAVAEAIVRVLYFTFVAVIVGFWAIVGALVGGAVDRERQDVPSRSSVS